MQDCNHPKNFTNHPKYFTTYCKTLVGWSCGILFRLCARSSCQRGSTAVQTVGQAAFQSCYAKCQRRVRGWCSDTAGGWRLLRHCLTGVLPCLLLFIHCLCFTCGTVSPVLCLLVACLLVRTWLSPTLSLVGVHCVRAFVMLVCLLF